MIKKKKIPPELLGRKEREKRQKERREGGREGKREAKSRIPRVLMDFETGCQETWRNQGLLLLLALLCVWGTLANGDLMLSTV